LYTGPKVRKYISSLDLSEGDEMLSRFSDDQNFMHTQTVSGRKWFMMRETIKFIEWNAEKGLSSQVIIPGAGIAPFSAALSEMYPQIQIFDIDLYGMVEKALMLRSEFKNIECITADLEDVSFWTSQLEKVGFDSTRPTIMVLEGITYYLTKAGLARIFEWANTHRMTIIGEFGFPPDSVIPEHRDYPRRVFEIITGLSNHPGASFYTREEFLKMASGSGYSKTVLTPMREMQIIRTGNPYPFEKENACWIEPFRSEP
jgi:hypothetical protein